MFSHTQKDVLNADIQLLKDLDFSEINLRVPLGSKPDGSCIAYGGNFHGNGHSIEGVHMSETSTDEKKSAGLFCSLKNASLGNLYIGSSCVFTGYNVGALSVSVTGALIVTNVISEATVNGHHNVGGFIGYVEGAMDGRTVLSFERSTIQGTVTASHGSAGGLIGSISHNTNMDITISNCTNNLKVSGNGKCV